MHAFLAEFKVYAIGESPADVSERLRTWRSLAQACGFDPGAGAVRQVPDGQQLPAEVAAELERARTRTLPSERARTRAVEAIASRLEGDLDRAAGIVDAIDQAGALTATVAAALGHARAVGE